MFLETFHSSHTATLGTSTVGTASLTVFLFAKKLSTIDLPLGIWKRNEPSHTPLHVYVPVSLKLLKVLVTSTYALKMYLLEARPVVVTV